ncbi:MAG: dTDP-4-dehydrorhamnose reductase [Xanthomarina gelatinilytica]|uniref:dTDP-4-dehydrorhamnose reductase n=1 Tax=Xanthomarina gelatinilytica TaxID=1137281 RepID=UPI003A8A89AD
MMNILVTGGDGQLARCIKDIASKELNFIYTDYLALDITCLSSLESFFKAHPIAYCINCAAYTAVDEAESHPEAAFNINETGAKNLALVCKKHDTILIHISTDFVFDGTKSTPYTELDSPNPLGVYGASKLQGEKHIQSILSKYFIIRTSWLYSEHGHNFVKTMLRLFQEKDLVKVVDDQIGSPTYAGDLALFIHRIIALKSTHYGLYHFSNLGATTWYGFAKAIQALSKSTTEVVAVPTSEFPTKALRPSYSVLDTTNTQEVFGTEIESWEKRLSKAVSRCH